MPESGQQKHSITLHHHKKAYATVLHSSEAYVCGAIALAQIVMQNKINNLHSMEPKVLNLNVLI